MQTADRLDWEGCYDDNGRNKKKKEKSCEQGLLLMILQYSIALAAQQNQDQNLQQQQQTYGQKEKELFLGVNGGCEKGAGHKLCVLLADIMWHQAVPWAAR